MKKIIRKYFLSAAVTLYILNAGAQTDSLKWVKEINEQVWRPFTGYIISGDNAGLSTLHSKRITRVQIDNNSILDYEKYFPADNGKKKWPLDEGVSRFFELRFDKRINNGTKAWESGYYKGGLQKDGKEISSYYGRFFVVLEKENSNWKIVVDADTAENANEYNFKKAGPIN